MLCCCFRFRIPRTKQDIEADYQRRKIAKKFRDRLACIKNSEMDEMTLQKGEFEHIIYNMHENGSEKKDSLIFI